MATNSKISAFRTHKIGRKNAQFTIKIVLKMQLLASYSKFRLIIHLVCRLNTYGAPAFKILMITWRFAMKVDLILIYGEIWSISAIDAIASELGACWIWYFGQINFTLVGYLSYISKVQVNIVPLYLYCLKYPPRGYDIVDGR